ncbi:fimbrial protein [Photorhabdus sp. CRCIA-P01]|uniref:fimbrial protein n=1 Tax=Photorhabdus sp. CRCIA-P01 TaxID=2019570 RepID=UPI000E59D1BC|nr:fimbrial protein [Photorhabdus sp. CRCIA-P01]
MKKNFILASLVTILGIFSSFSALSYDGKIQFRGTILANGCTISSGSSGIQEVNFGKIPKERFKGTAGTIVSSQPFTIDLTNCPGSTIGIRFLGNVDSNDNTLYSSKISGIGIELTKNGGEKINSNAEVSGYPITTRNARIPLIANLKSTNATVGDGAINSDVNFTLIYP